jgi:hypothetical protein
VVAVSVFFGGENAATGSGLDVASGFVEGAEMFYGVDGRFRRRFGGFVQEFFDPFESRGWVISSHHGRTNESENYRTELDASHQGFLAAKKTGGE